MTSAQAQRYPDVCQSCGDDVDDDDSVQLRFCGHVLCEGCSDPCRLCDEEGGDRK